MNLSKSTIKSFSKKLSGFNVKVIFFDIKNNLDDENAESVSLKEIHKQADVISLHTSLTKESVDLINQNFINKCTKPFWLINTARGKCVNTSHLVKALKERKILGAALDVLEYEKSSFEKISNPKDNSLEFLIESDNVIITPHIAGWTKESKIELVKVAIDKIKKSKMKNILILCTGNSCRSQIAEGYFSCLLKEKAGVYSAGIETHGLNSYAVETMSRDRVDISKNTTNAQKGDLILILSLLFVTTPKKTVLFFHLKMQLKFIKIFLILQKLQTLIMMTMINVEMKLKNLL